MPEIFNRVILKGDMPEENEIDNNICNRCRNNDDGYCDITDDDITGICYSCPDFIKKDMDYTNAMQKAVKQSNEEQKVDNYEIIKEFRKEFYIKGEENDYYFSIPLKPEKFEQFILTKLKEERIKTLEEIEAHIKTKMWHELGCPAHSLSMQPESECNCQMEFVLDLINNLKN